MNREMWECGGAISQSPTATPLERPRPRPTTRGFSGGRDVGSCCVIGPGIPQAYAGFQFGALGVSAGG